MSNFEDLLKLKKVKFLAAVEISAKSLKVPKPKVKFWEKDCPHYSGREKAHIHTDTRVICISEIDLRKMDFDDIEECASHEVTHLTDTLPETNDVHSHDFYNRHDKTKMFNWRPPGGVIAITDSPVPKKTVKKQGKLKHSREYCNNCSKKVKLSRCKYCNKYYCDDCIRATEPGSYIGNDSKLFVNQIKKDEFIYHPCPDYVDYLALQRKIQNIRYGEALDKLTGRTPKYKRVYEMDIPDESEEQDNYNNSSKISRKQERIDEKKKLKLEKEELEREIEEKQIKHLKEQESTNRQYLTDDEAKQKLEDYKRQVQEIVNKNKTLKNRKDIPVKERPEYKDTVIIKKNMFEKLKDLKNYIKSIFVKKD